MTDDQKSLLKELVEAPYGKAETILKTKGFWDEKRDGTFSTYRLRVHGKMPVSAIVKVQARTDEEAEKLAQEIASDPLFEWRDFDDVEVQYSSIETCDR